MIVALCGCVVSISDCSVERVCVCVFVTRVSPIGSGGESGVFGAPEDGEGLGGDVTREHRRLGGGGVYV